MSMATRSGYDIGRSTTRLKALLTGGPPGPASSRTPIYLRGGSYAFRWARLVAGLALFALGLALMIRANLGLSAWDVLHDALQRLTPLTFGQVVVVVSVFVLVVSIALRVRPGPGTLANALLVGVFTDAILRLPFPVDVAAGSVPLRLIVMVGGVWGIALGSALYISANLGAGPRDALMLGLAMRIGRSVGAARTAIEAAVLIFGVMLGGSAGVGTAAFVILIGPAINTSFRFFGIQPPREKPLSLARWGAQAVRPGARRGQIGSDSFESDPSRHRGGRA
jgi:uncharacterized membrane protein YczE